MFRGIRMIIAEGRRVLTAVRVLPTIGHAHQSLLVNWPPTDVLVLELSAVYRVTASAVAFGDVAALYHKFIDDAVEGRHLVGERRFRAST